MGTRLGPYIFAFVILSLVLLLNHSDVWAKAVGVLFWIISCIVLGEILRRNDEEKARKVRFDVS